MRRIIIFLLVVSLCLSMSPIDIYGMHREDLISDMEVVLLTKEEIDLVGLVCLGEAEGEPELGKRLVIDTILNRMDSQKYPDNATDVCWQKGQYICLHNGRCSRLTVTDEIRQLVVEECMCRENDKVMYFSTASSNGLHVGAHYFR